MESLISDYRFFLFVICGKESIGTSLPLLGRANTPLHSARIVGGLVLTNTNKDKSCSSHLCSRSDCDSSYQQPVDERPGQKRFAMEGRIRER